MIKTFCINGQSYEFIRPSIPNLHKNSSNNFFKNGECNLTNELIYQSRKNKIFGEEIEEKDNMNKILEEKFNFLNYIDTMFKFFI